MEKDSDKSERVLITLKSDVYQLLIKDAEDNGGLKVATRAAQILTIKLREVEANKNNTSNNTQQHNDNSKSNRPQLKR